ncbi:glycosyltransferase family 2 protein [Halomonas salina]|uniref:glycosyltransferase family 2 protein n=1 Tax=Halomonas salina TaxID=42565 RepID=UPI00190F9CCD|nr:glycosyltransferase family 2 protein [Halomonas salina]
MTLFMSSGKGRFFNFMSGPVFSVIMPVYNAVETVREAIESVLAQSFSDLEVIVVDDHSVDGSRDVVESYRYDARVKPVLLEENRGVAGARNEGIKEAKGKYIAFLDADDIWLSDKLARQKEFFEAGCTVVFSSYRRFDEEGEKEVVAAKPSVTYQDMLRGNCIGNLTGAYDCHALGKVYQKAIGHEDYLMWLDLIKQSGEATGIEDVLAKYRVSSASLSGNKLTSSLWVWSIYRQHLELGFFSSLKCFLMYALHNVLRRL